ncbi:MAG: hypothetical protein FWB76_05445 [Oscillospiraceae bacterium]|nr:hypothetical protein [Oscillospiraceae bacterium]
MATYRSVDELQHLGDFHDVYVRRAAWQGNNLVCSIYSWIVPSENSQNSHSTAMFVNEAEVVFAHCRIVHIKHLGMQEFCDNIVTTVQPHILKLNEYARFAAEDMSDCPIEHVANYTQMLDGNYTATVHFCFHEVELIFSKVTVSWDTYAGKYINGCIIRDIPYSEEDTTWLSEKS